MISASWPLPSSYERGCMVLLSICDSRNSFLFQGERIHRTPLPLIYKWKSESKRLSFFHCCILCPNSLTLHSAHECHWLRWGTLYKTGVGKIRSAEGTEYGQELNPSEPYMYTFYRTSNGGWGGGDSAKGSRQRGFFLVIHSKKLYFEKFGFCCC